MDAPDRKTGIRPQLLSRQEAAAYLGVSVRSLDALVQRRELPVVRLPHSGTVGGDLRRVLLDVADLDRLIARSKTEVG